MYVCLNCTQQRVVLGLLLDDSHATLVLLRGSKVSVIQGFSWELGLRKVIAFTLNHKVCAIYT